MARAAPIENRALRGVFSFSFFLLLLFFLLFFYLFPPFVHLIGIRAVRSLSLPEFQRFLISFSESLLEEESIFLRRVRAASFAVVLKDFSFDERYQRYPNWNVNSLRAALYVLKLTRRIITFILENQKLEACTLFSEKFKVTSQSTGVYLSIFVNKNRRA